MKGEKFCPDYPDKMSIDNPDIIMGYVCYKYKRVKIREYKTTQKLDGDFDMSPFANSDDMFNKARDFYDNPTTTNTAGGVRMVGMFPIDEMDDEFLKKFKKQLRKMGFKI